MPWLCDGARRMEAMIGGYLGGHDGDIVRVSYVIYWCIDGMGVVASIVNKCLIHHRPDWL